jgi:hypothetical protein
MKIIIFASIIAFAIATKKSAFVNPDLAADTEADF